MKGLKRKFYLAIVLIISINIFGTIGYMIIEGWNFMDSLFMTVITITTVGYGEVHELTRPGEIFTIVLLTAGVGIILYVLSSEAKVIIEGELQDFLGRRRLENKIKQLKGHYIICGYGRMGKIIAREFQEKGVKFVVIDNNPDVFRDIDGILSIEADATRDDTLVQAGIKKAKGLVTVLSTDAENLFVVLSAKELNPDVFIVTRAVDESSQNKFTTAGADRVVSPYYSGSVRIANLILKPAVVDFLELATKGSDVELKLEEIAVNQESPYADKTLEESRIGKELGVIVLAIKSSDGKIKFNPSSKTVINPGDTLIAIGELAKLRKLESKAARI